MSDFGETPRPEIPEFKTYTLENWGFILRDSASLQPDIFPFKVEVPFDSGFFKSIYEGVYKGKGTTVAGGSNKVRLKGAFVEHEAIIGVNDLGQLMISNEIYEGNTH